MILDDENIDLYVSVEGNSETTDDTLKEEKKTRKHGLLNWLKLRVCTVWIYVYFSSSFVKVGSCQLFIPKKMLISLELCLLIKQVRRIDIVTLELIQISPLSCTTNVY